MRIPRILVSTALLGAAVCALACGGSVRDDGGVGGVIIETVAPAGTPGIAGNANGSLTAANVLATATQPVTSSTARPTTSVPTAVATSTPRPNATSTAPAASSTTAPAQGSGAATVLNIVSLTSRVARSGTASLTVQTAPGAQCTIVYALPVSGNTSTAAGLEAKAADATGKAAWSWTIGPSTSPGSGAIKVSCAGLSVSARIEIT